MVQGDHFLFLNRRVVSLVSFCPSFRKRREKQPKEKKKKSNQITAKISTRIDIGGATRKTKKEKKKMSSTQFLCTRIAHVHTRTDRSVECFVLDDYQHRAGKKSIMIGSQISNIFFFFFFWPKQTSPKMSI